MTRRGIKTAHTMLLMPMESRAPRLLRRELGNTLSQLDAKFIGKSHLVVLKINTYGNKSDTFDIKNDPDAMCSVSMRLELVLGPTECTGLRFA